MTEPWWAQDDDISGLAGLPQGTKKKLREAGIRNADQVAQAGPEKLLEILPHRAMKKLKQWLRGKFGETARTQP